MVIRPRPAPAQRGDHIDDAAHSGRGGHRGRRLLLRRRLLRALLTGLPGLHQLLYRFVSKFGTKDRLDVPRGFIQRCNIN